MLKETLSHILGEAPDSALASRITETVMEFPEVTGTYDLVLHDYGPDVYQGSLHIEIPDVFTADDIDRLTRLKGLRKRIRFMFNGHTDTSIPHI